MPTQLNENSRTRIDLFSVHAYPVTLHVGESVDHQPQSAHYELPQDNAEKEPARRPVAPGPAYFNTTALIIHARKMLNHTLSMIQVPLTTKPTGCKGHQHEEQEESRRCRRTQS